MKNNKGKNRLDKSHTFYKMKEKELLVLTEALFYCLFSLGNYIFIQKITIISLLKKDSLQGANDENWY